MRFPAPTPPDLLAPWRTRILAALEAVGIQASVGPRRPASTVNLEGNFVRIMCLGGPWRAKGLWLPRIATESWAPTVVKAQQLDRIVARATARLLGLEQAPTSPDQSGFYITSCELELQGSDQSLDGAPFVLTTAACCLQVIQLVPTP